MKKWYTHVLEFYSQNRPIKTDKFLKIKNRNCLLKKRVFITSLNTLHNSDV